MKSKDDCLELLRKAQQGFGITFKNPLARELFETLLEETLQKKKRDFILSQFAGLSVEELLTLSEHCRNWVEKPPEQPIIPVIKKKRGRQPYKYLRM